MRHWTEQDTSEDRRKKLNRAAAEKEAIHAFVVQRRQWARDGLCVACGKHPAARDFEPMGKGKDCVWGGVCVNCSH